MKVRMYESYDEFELNNDDFDKWIEFWDNVEYNNNNEKLNIRISEDKTKINIKEYRFNFKDRSFSPAVYTAEFDTEDNTIWIQSWSYYNYGITKHYNGNSMNSNNFKSFDEFYRSEVGKKLVYALCDIE